ncbi:MAG TPA: GNAT family N-acetyltransferase [Jiangellaceae bacterium]|nr:GNAT family N-acetyltransferase [Jiangellaceae bacterium]
MSATGLELDIRPPRRDELAAAGTVTVAAYQAQGLALAGYLRELADTDRRHREAELLVAVDGDGAVLGTVTFCPAGSSWREIAREHEAEFRMLAVDPAVQGRGVGRALVNACLDRARELGFRGMVLSTPAHNARAHELYEAMGFARDPARDWTPVPGVDLVAYTLRLT